MSRNKAAESKNQTQNEDEKPQLKIQKIIPFDRPNSEAVQRSPKFIRTNDDINRYPIGGVSRRFSQKCDLNDVNSFMFVGQAGTKVEKMLQTRANLLANKQGLMSNGLVLKEPPKKVFNKLVKDQNLTKVNSFTVGAAGVKRATNNQFGNFFDVSSMSSSYSY